MTSPDTKFCIISNGLDVLRESVESIEDNLLYDESGQDVPAACLTGITVLLALTDQWGPEYFTDEESSFIMQADRYLSDTIKEFRPNE